MRIAYISPSSLFSRSANSVHVLRMCEALAGLGHEVTLYAHRTEPSEDDLMERVQGYYGVKLPNARLVSFYTAEARLLNAKIAARACADLLASAPRGRAPELVISRNLYASALLEAVPRKRLLCEFHGLEQGLRKRLQKRLLTSRKTGKVVISNALVECLENHHGTRFPDLHVFHDAAPAGRTPLTSDERSKGRMDRLASHPVSRFPRWAGYFGHLYRGRGIEVIRALAERHPETAFLVFGGNEPEIRALREENRSPNLFVMGFLAPGQALDMMAIMDVLLMPYQRCVSIDSSGSTDTARWMSPMKMFEYMSTGVPLVSSALPVLKEVLEHGRNSLLAAPEKVEEWSACLSRLEREPTLAPKLAKNAFAEYEREHNWLTRARKMVELS
jgi:glycosyltransferase involved in cell wall biosynthesis